MTRISLLLRFLQSISISHSICTGRVSLGTTKGLLIWNRPYTGSIWDSSSKMSRGASSLEACKIFMEQGFATSGEAFISPSLRSLQVADVGTAAIAVIYMVVLCKTIGPCQGRQISTPTRRCNWGWPLMSLAARESHQVSVRTREPL